MRGLPVLHRRRWRWAGLLVSHLGLLLAMLLAVAALPRLMPGDPVAALWAEGTTDRVVDETLRSELIQRYGLDRPLPLQVVDETLRLLSGDAGTSIRYAAPVVGLIGERLPRTLLLMGIALPLGYLLGAGFGAYAGWRDSGVVGRCGAVLSTLVKTVPSFFLGSVALYVFAVQNRWFPLSGFTTPFAHHQSWWAQFLDISHHLVLPACVLAAPVAAGQFLLARAALAGQRRSPHLAGAIARGLRESQLLRWHAVPCAMPPILALAAVQISAVTGGAIVVETVFAFPGIGALLVDGIAARDYPLLQGVFATFAVLIVGANLIADAVVQRMSPGDTR